MKLFSSLFTKKESTSSVNETVLLAPVSGCVAPLEESPDQAFACGALGPGCVIWPKTETLCSPLEGTVVTCLPTLHAIGLISDNGIEVLIHIGVDTVEMGSAGFTAHISQGQRVTKKQKLISFDRDEIRRTGHSDAIMMVVTNAEQFSSVIPVQQEAISVGDEVLLIKR